ncbi:unnamed protein product [Rhizoctonia solani]|uniref:Uncharacterized protein n=1 Tax=Rhizoctonia solani TaxID=456999 RepID=A0A8H3C825_9AGAM|nr:unnamed protein product [Rhizoctonia solani]
MSFFLGSSGSSGNSSLAWSLGNGGKGRILIEFPFTIDSGWYSEQSCTKFRNFEHRKERKGFRHEFIVLKLLDGSVCRVERMGDPNARFNAISPQGSVAYDMAQCFRPEDTDQACLETSDVVVEITLPYDFDIMDVLKICRAIHEGEKTRKYTLQVYNCWFFSLAIQVCLVRWIADWEDRKLLGVWLSRTSEAIEALNNVDQKDGTSNQPSHFPSIFRIYYILSSHDTRKKSIIMEDFKSRLKTRISSCSAKIKQGLIWRVNNLLWYSTIGSGLSDFIEESVEAVVMDMLQERRVLVLLDIIAIDARVDYAHLLYPL